MIASSSLPRRHQLYADSKAPLGREARLVHSRHVDNLAAGILAGLDLSRRNYYALTKAPSTPVMYHNSPPGATRPHSGVPLAPTGGATRSLHSGMRLSPLLEGATRPRAQLAPQPTRGRHSPRARLAHTRSSPLCWLLRRSPTTICNFALL